MNVPGDELKSISINALPSQIEELDDWCRKNNTTRSRVVTLMITIFLNQTKKIQHDVSKYAKELERR